MQKKIVNSFTIKRKRVPQVPTIEEKQAGKIARLKDNISELHDIIEQQKSKTLFELDFSDCDGVGGRDGILSGDNIAVEPYTNGNIEGDIYKANGCIYLNSEKHGNILIETAKYLCAPGYSFMLGFDVVSATATGFILSFGGLDMQELSMNLLQSTDKWASKLVVASPLTTELIEITSSGAGSVFIDNLRLSIVRTSTL